MIEIERFNYKGNYKVTLPNSSIREVRPVLKHKHFPEIKSIVYYDNYCWFYSRETPSKILKKIKKEKEKWQN